MPKKAYFVVKLNSKKIGVLRNCFSGRFALFCWQWKNLRSRTRLQTIAAFVIGFSGDIIAFAKARLTPRALDRVDSAVNAALSTPEGYTGKAADTTPTPGK